MDADVREWEKKTAKSAETELKSRAAKIANDLAQSHADKNFCIAEGPDADGKLLQGVAEALKTKINGVIFLVGARDASVALVAYVPKQLTTKFQANKLIQQIAPIVGGKGGGRAGERPGRRERRQQDRRGACEGAGASELRREPTRTFVILNEAKNLGLIFGLILPGNRPKMFRSAQHDSAVLT